MGTVLVVTDPDDHQTDLVVAELHRRGRPMMRLDPGTADLRLDVEPADGRWRGEVDDGHRAVRLEEVVSVLWRWPTPPAGHPAITDPAARAWAAREDHAALHGVLRTLPVRWINHPDRAARTRKPDQLLTAKACGLAVPDTLIATTAAAVQQWTRGRDVLYKPFWSQGAHDCGMVLAGRIDPATLPAHLGSAGIFQEIVRGTPVRLTWIGGRPFAVRIVGADQLDWRTVQGVAYEPVTVPGSVCASVAAYMSCYGLEYGAFDFIVDGGGRWWHLECNDRGMYGFVELATGLPITAALADRLTQILDQPRPAVAQ